MQGHFAIANVLEDLHCYQKLALVKLLKGVPMKIKSNMISQVLALVVFLTSAVSVAKTVSSERKAYSVNELVDQFYAKKEALQNAKKLFAGKLNHPPHQPIDCHPEGPSCVDVACLKLGSFGCDDIAEVQAVTRACRGNYDGNCLNAACTKLGSFGCDDMDEVQAVARACVGNYETDCLNSVCSRLGSFGCDDLDEIVEVLRSCAGN